MQSAIQLFDIQCGIGALARGNRQPLTSDALTSSMQSLAISGALVRNIHEHDATDLPFDNANLFRWCAENPQLLPCPVIIPNSGCDLSPESGQVADAIKHGAAAMWIRPATDGWLLADWVADPLFNALQDRHVPVFCVERMVGIEQIAGLARRFPQLPLILADTNYRTQRIVLPLLRTFKNVYLSLGNNYCVYHGIEQIVAKQGPEQLLFGTNFPDSEPMAAVTAFMYSEIPDDQKQMIGHGNFDRLRKGIVQ